MRFCKLRCAVKNYEWGKPYLESIVAQLSKSDESFIPEDKPYAELWMGTHPSGPSVVQSCNNILLSDLISKEPDCLGDKIKQKFGNNLPFLFKVLSVNKALSIQVHPDKARAEKLHVHSPEFYPDDNHKPEMAIALTRFEALCCFRPLGEIIEFLTEVPQLRNVIGEEASECLLSVGSDEAKGKEALKNCFTALMTSSEECYKKNLSDLANVFVKCDHPCKGVNSMRDLFLRVHSDYPGDIGCFCLFFLNHIILQPGQSLFLAANEPHAYLLGDCIECMACSDNVVRAGLTPKPKDVATLCDILSYNTKSVQDTIFPSFKDPLDPYVTIYNPPVNEFSIMKIEVPQGDVIYNLQMLDSASIILIVKGSVTINDFYNNVASSVIFNSGSAVFISSGVSLSLHIDSSELLMFRAYCS